MTEFTQTSRHYCRNRRCRSKLPSPASDPRKAFCTRGCHSSFYLKRCLVCENDKPAGSTARRKLCRRPKCEGSYRKNSAHYSFLGADTTSAANAPRSAQSTGSKSAGLDDRPWHIVAGPKISAAVYHCTALPVDPRRPGAAMQLTTGGAFAKKKCSVQAPATRSEGNAIGLEAVLAKRSGRGRSQHPRLSQTRAGGLF